jgi:hypothetical protein
MTVLADGKAVGRIYEDASASTPPELRRLWSVTAIVPAIPNVTNGYAATLDEAKASFARHGRRRRRVAANELFLMHADQRHSKHFPARSISDNDLIARDLPRALVPCEVLGHSHCLLHCIDNGR